MYTFEGTIRLIYDTMKFDSGFQKKEIVLTSNEQYPQDVKFEFLKDDVNLLDGFKQGDKVTLTFAIRGNEYKDKYYVNLNGLSITNSKFETPEIEMKESDENDDLPF